MNLLFCHDGPIDIDEYGNGYPANMNNEALERYYKIANHIYYVTRTNLIDPKETTNKMINMDKIDYISCPNLSTLNGQLFQKRESQKIISEIIKKSDLVVVRLPSTLGNVAVDMAIKHNKKYVIEVVGCVWQSYWNYNIKGKLVAPLAYLKTKNIIRNAEYAVYVTNEFLQKRYPTNGEQINASNVNIQNTVNDVLEQRIEHINRKSKDDKLVIGTTAAVDVRYKGQQYIIEALGKLKEQDITNIEYHLVGGGNQNYLKMIAKKFNVENQVIFLGKLSHNEVFQWLDSIDLYAQPSRQEGLPRALIEAMSRGVPSFGARTAGIPELLEKECTFSNSKKNITEIISIIRTMNKEMMIEQATRNFKEAQKYDKDIIDLKRDNFFMKYKKNVTSNARY